MRLNLIVLCLLLTGSGFAQFNTIINANINGLKAGTKIYLKSDVGKTTDSTIAKNGHFVIKKFIAPGKGDGYRLQIVSKKWSPHNTLNLYLEKGTINIKSSGPAFKNAVVSGPNFISSLNLYNKQVTNNYQVKDLSTYYEKLVEADAKGDSVAVEYWNNKVVIADSISDRLKVEWIKKNPSSPISVMKLYELRVTLGLSEMKELFNSLQPVAKRNIIAPRLKEIIQKRDLTDIGKQALDFNIPDTSGNNISLAKYKGKYVLLDFWASWCGPCRGEYPYLRQAYKNYKDKNFTILGISLDMDKNQWVQAIYEHELYWDHTSELKYMEETTVAKQYGVIGIPSNFLIDPEGKIIAKDLRGEDLENYLKKILK